jgi:nitrous oxidase accessory protein
MRPGRLRACSLAVLAAWGASVGPASASLQDLVDATPAGAELRPPPGVYAGPLVLRRPIRIEGGGGVRIDAGGEGSVVQVLTSGVTLRGLHLTGSGSNHDSIDAGIQVRGDDNVIEDNWIEDCLFGIDLQQSNRNLVKGNRIGSKDLGLGLRGDGVRLWYSRENRIVDNLISDVRDVVVWYSGANLISGNRVTGGRYGLHFMYSEKNRVEGNEYRNNTVGVFLMYSDGIVLRDNWIKGAVGAMGMGIGFKESSDVTVEGNVILNCARGVYLDISPYQPETTNRFVGNRLAYNGSAVVFHSDWHGNLFRENEFKENFTQVAVRGGGSAGRNLWEGNRWDDYRGFDRDGDGVGDTPYELYAYADRIWQEMPEAAFFRGSPLFEAIDFLDQLAPFSEPTRILQDRSPRFESGAGP